MPKIEGSRISIDFLIREIAADLHLPMNIVSKIVEAVFLKILKHLMYGRSVRIRNFGIFRSVFHQKKQLGRAGIKQSKTSKKNTSIPRYVPKLTFTETAIAMVQEMQTERAERKQRDIDNANEHACSKISSN